MVRSSRSRSAALAILLVVAAAPLAAHRRDEYLQAARLAIEPDRVELQLDLTPGIALAGRVIAEIDRDRDGVVSDAEARAYAAVVQHDTRLEVDGRVVPVRMVESRPATVDAMRNGIGTVQVRWTAALPALAPGPHAVRFTNGHDADIGVYLANVLVPASDRVAVTAQDRDVDQKTFTVSYELKGQRSARWSGALLVLLGGAAAAAVVVRWSARPSRS
jgi:hypothetical protein